MSLTTFHPNTLWQEYFPECKALWKEHWNEMAMAGGAYPPNPSTHHFAALEMAGALSILTVRVSGVMAGYYIAVVREHPHYGVLCGFEDSYFLGKQYRKGTLGVKLLKEGENMVRNRGAKELFVQENCLVPTKKLWERLGYTHTHNVYRRTL